MLGHPLTAHHPRHPPPTLTSQAGFPGTMAKSQLQAHVDSKHSKSAFAECFPGYKEEDEE